MSPKNPWGVVEIEPEHYSVSFKERTVSWHYNRPSNYRKKPSVPTGEGEYANLPKKDKLLRRTRRRRGSFIKLVYALEDRPDGFVSIDYPHRLAKDVTPEQFKKDIAFIGRKIRKICPDGWAIHIADWSIKAKLHTHLLLRCNVDTAPEDTRKLVKKVERYIRKAWAKRVNSNKKKLVRIDHIADEVGATKCKAYLSSGKKFGAQVHVTALLGKRMSFGVFNAKNMRVATSYKIKASPEEFKVIRKIIKDNIRHGDGEYSNKHEYKVLNSKSYLHISHDNSLKDQIEHILREMRGEKKGK